MKKMNEIRTILGTITPEELGFCQFHEHIALSRGVSYKINPALCIDDTEKSIQEVRRYKKAGGRTLIDAQPGGCNRDTEMLAEIARQTGIHILASTGFHKMIFYPENHWIFHISECNLTSYFVEELMTGMYKDNDTVWSSTQTDHRAGIVKAALDAVNLTPLYKKLFTSAASACMKTGTTMMIHVERGSDPLLLLTFLKGLGLLPSQMVFCHLDRAVPDLDVHKTIASAGAYLEYDTIGRFKYHSDEHEISIIKEMIRNGLEDQLLFSLDTTAERLKSYTPDAIGLDYILTSFLDRLRRNGITEEQIRKISNINCIRALLNP